MSATTDDEGRAGAEEMGAGAGLEEGDMRGRPVVRYESFADALRYSAFQAASRLSIRA